MTFTVPISNNVTLKQTLNNLCSAIAEHKWDDAFTLLPLAIAHSKGRIHTHFVWKLIHLIMLKKNIPQESQIKIILLMFNFQDCDIACGWLAGALHDIELSNLETIYQKYIYMVCVFYLASRMYHVPLPSIKKENNISEDKLMELRKNCTSLGIRALDQLHKSLISFMDLDNYQKENQDMCEWLIAPLIDLEEKLRQRPENTEMLYDRFGTNQNFGLQILEEYLEDRNEHLPTLVLFYEYIDIYHSEEEDKKFTLLKTIVKLCPDHLLVLRFVEIILETEDSKNEEVMVNSSEKCSLQNSHPSSLSKGVSLLTHFLEYNQWNYCSKAWQLLRTILKRVHIAWTNCWDCKKCNKMRKLLSKEASNMTLWPTLFWERLGRKISSEKQAKIMVDIAYTAFFFAYDCDIYTKSCTLFQNYPSYHEELKQLIKLKGPTSKEFLSYLHSEQNQRFANISAHFQNIDIIVDGVVCKYNDSGNNVVKLPHKKKRRLNTSEEGPCLEKK